MKNIIILFVIAVFFFSCKKETVTPDPVIQIQTVTVTVHDTVYCTPLSDIIQGTWYCYKINSTINSSSEQVNFTQTTLTWPTEFANTSVSFASNYSSFIDSQSNHYLVSVFQCNEIKITDWSGKIYYLRRNP